VLAAYGDAARTSAVEAGWEDRWREFHRPVRVGPLWVGPPWETPPPSALAVVVDPGRAFGTGAHPTTRLCLELLLDRPPGSVLDVGCGSGVLAIAAARLGHAPVLAVDVDASAAAAARTNAAANGVAVEVRRLDALAGPLPPAELALANIALGAVDALGGRVQATLLATSGYLAADEPAPAGFRRLERRVLDGWAADLFERC
jgi:ribosomal protein L11 methyltransferase